MTRVWNNDNYGSNDKNAFGRLKRTETKRIFNPSQKNDNPPVNRTLVVFNNLIVYNPRTVAYVKHYVSSMRKNQ